MLWSLYNKLKKLFKNNKKKNVMTNNDDLRKQNENIVKTNEDVKREIGVVMMLCLGEQYYYINPNEFSCMEKDLAGLLYMYRSSIVELRKIKLIEQLGLTYTNTKPLEDGVMFLKSKLPFDLVSLIEQEVEEEFSIKN